MNRARQAGYRLLGARFDYLLHTRPAEWPIVTAHTGLGCVLALGLDRVGRGERIGAAALGIALWVVCLNGGTLALNSAHDRDEGDIAYLSRPPTPPARLAWFGLSLMLLGFAAAFLLPEAYRVAYAVCLILSILYSVPPVRLKAVPGVDWIINMIGFGTLTPYAGWAATDVPLTPAGRLILAGFCPLFAAFYPLTQIYQFEEDARRGDRTLARALGPGRSLRVALVLATVAFALFALTGVAAGWGAPDWWRWLALGCAAVAWSIVLVPWAQQHNRMTPPQHQRSMYHALLAWALTDLVVALVWAT